MLKAAAVSTPVSKSRSNGSLAASNSTPINQKWSPPDGVNVRTTPLMRKERRDGSDRTRIPMPTYYSNNLDGNVRNWRLLYSAWRQFWGRIQGQKLYPIDEHFYNGSYSAEVVIAEQKSYFETAGFSKIFCFWDNFLVLRHLSQSGTILALCMQVFPATAVPKFRALAPLLAFGGLNNWGASNLASVSKIWWTDQVLSPAFGALNPRALIAGTTPVIFGKISSCSILNCVET